MKRWLVMTLLLHSALPAAAQLPKEGDTPETMDSAAPKVPKDVVAPSQVNAETAAVSPVGGAPKAKPPKSDCSTTNPCATPTPAAR